MRCINGLLYCAHQTWNTWTKMATSNNDLFVTCVRLCQPQLGWIAAKYGLVWLLTNSMCGEIKQCFWCTFSILARWFIYWFMCSLLCFVCFASTVHDDDGVNMPWWLYVQFSRKVISNVWGARAPLSPWSIYFLIFSPFLLFSFCYWLYQIQIQITICNAPYFARRIRIFCPSLFFQQE